MAERTAPLDPRYASLRSPLTSAGTFVEADRETLLREENGCLQGKFFRRRGKVHYQRGLQVLRAGSLTLIAGRTTPVLSSNRSAHFSCFFAMPFIGGFVTRDGALCDEVGPGDLYLNQNYYGTSTIGYLSSLFVALDPRRLERTLGSISGGESLASIGTSLVVKAARRPGGSVGAGRLWTFISFLDRLYGEDPAIPSCLGVDEQFYRLLALALLEACGRSDHLSHHWSAAAGGWTNPLDDLVDWIRANAHASITLTDLEERSHYSARRLQTLFREKFGCTPMQFVRRQRLDLALQKLHAAGWDDSITSIARACGYRHLANFSSDFQRQFGLAPSALLRAAREGSRWL